MNPARRRLGVYVCHCGGNISDYVDVERVVDAVRDEADVVVTRDAMFTCSDATQQEIEKDIAEQGLDGLVVASCSPKLHTFTFRGVARRAGLNPYRYTQVNIREQCSWAHTDDHEGATAKAVSLVRAGIARTRLSESLEPTVVETVGRALVVGAGVAGMRAAIGLADVGLGVFLVEREAELGGWVRGFGPTYPQGETGRSLTERLAGEIRRRHTITVLTGAEVEEKSGTYGDYRVVVRVGEERITLEVGQIVVATGFDTYEPRPGEYGYGLPGVVTLPEFRRLLDEAARAAQGRRSRDGAEPGGDGAGPPQPAGGLVHRGREVHGIAYVYCVGNRNEEHPYCSRFCCSAAVHESLLAAALAPGLRQYHLYRDLRAYGRNELMYSESRRRGSLYIKFADDAPPRVERHGQGLRVTVRDLLTGGEEVSIDADLVVLVTGAVPRENGGLVSALKIPVGRDGFFNEIHPKLRPVETVVDGLLIAGACQYPKTIDESVASGLAAVTQAATVLTKGVAELDPQIAVVNPGACTGCGACVESCPFGAISMVARPAATSVPGSNGHAPARTEAADRVVAAIDAAGCKGCGGCTPVCPAAAIDLRGYTDAQVVSMIDALAEEVRA